MFCTACGTNLPDSARFCYACGQATPSADAVSPDASVFAEAAALVLRESESELMQVAGTGFNVDIVAISEAANTKVTDEDLRKAERLQAFANDPQLADNAMLSLYRGVLDAYQGATAAERHFRTERWSTDIERGRRQRQLEADLTFYLQHGLPGLVSVSRVMSESVQESLFSRPGLVAWLEDRLLFALLYGLALTRRKLTSSEDRQLRAQLGPKRSAVIDRVATFFRDHVKF